MNLSDYKYLVIIPDMKLQKHFRQLLGKIGADNQKINCCTDLPTTANNTAQDIVFYYLQSASGFDDLHKIKAQYLNTPVIVIIENDNLSIASQVIQLGIEECLFTNQLSKLDLQKAIDFAFCRKEIFETGFLQVKESNERFEYATQAINDIIYDWDVYENKIAWSNSINTLGYQPYRLDNVQKCMMAIHPDDKEYIISGLHKILSGENEGDWFRSYRIKKANGDYALVEDKAIIIKNKRGHISRVIGALRDVTEKTKAEERLSKSEKEYSQIFNQGPISMFIFKVRNLQIVNVNEPALHLYEYSRKDCLNKTIESIFVKEDVYKFLQSISKIDLDGEPKKLGEWRSITSTGNLIHVDIMGHSIDIDSEPCIMISCINITDKVLSNELLEEANERFQFVKEATRDITWDYDMISGELFWDDKYNEVFGYKNFDTRNNFEFWKSNIHPDDRQRVSSSFEKCIQGKRDKWSDIYRYKKKNGDFLHVEDHAIILRNGTGFPYRAVGSLRNITERIQNESQLNILASSLRTISDSVLVTDALPIDQPGPCIVYANNAFYNLTGYTPEEVIGNTPRILQGKKTSRKRLNILKRALKQQTSCTVQLINYKKNGEEFWSEITVDPVFDVNGKCTHFTSIQRDITVAKEKEKESELFKKLNIEISKFKTIKDRIEFVLHILADFSGFEGAEGWTTNIDNTRLIRNGFYGKSKKHQAFFLNKKSNNIKKNQGLPGKVWEGHKMLIYNDLANNKDFLRADEAGKAGYNAAVAIPIFHTDQSLNGVILFLSTKKSLKLTHRVQRVLKRFSEQFGAEIERMKTEDELDTFFNMSPDLLCVLGPDGYFKKINKAFLTTTGYTEDEVMAKPAVEFVHPEDQQKTMDKAMETLNNKGNISNFLMCRYITKSGKTLKLLWNSIYSPEKKLFYTIAKNITQQQFLEDEIQRVKTVQQHVINSTDDFIWAIDNDYNLILANDAYLAGMKKHVGVAYKIGQKIISKTKSKWAIEEKVKQIWLDNYKRAMGGKHVIFNFDLIDRNNSKVQQEIYLHPIIDSNTGTVNGVACFSRDIAERTLHIEFIEEQNKRLIEIAHIQSHKVSGPLSRVMGLTNIILELEEDPSKLNETLKHLQESAKELKVIIDIIVRKTETDIQNKSAQGV